MYSQELKNKWHDDPKNWKLGIFYFNTADKRIVISKRLKLFGHYPLNCVSKKILGFDFN